jgi:ribonuclease D
MPFEVELPQVPPLPEKIITSPQDLQACCQQLASCQQFGMDTEFVGEATYHPRLCLVQVATSERLYLIDPLTVGPLDAFWKLVVDPANMVVVHAGREETRLCCLWTGQGPGRIFDLQIAAGLIGLPYPLGHGPLVNHLFGIHLAKGETLTEWRDRPLTPAQVRYAFDDVRYLLPAWNIINKRLEELGRSDWEREECTRMGTASLGEEFFQEKWRRLRGLGALNRSRLAVVRDLFQWREETAARLNRPARSIVRDDLLVEIARRDPSRERDLHPIRGLPRRDLPAILEVVKQARSLPLEKCPPLAEREQDPPQFGLVTAVLQAFLGNWCLQHRLAANLVASPGDVKTLVRAHRQGRLPDNSPLVEGWRRGHILPELLAFLEGRRRLRLAPVSAPVPFVIDDGEILPQ